MSRACQFVKSASRTLAALRQGSLALLLGLLLQAALPTSAETVSPDTTGGPARARLADLSPADVPHFDDCSTCMRCIDGHHGFDPDLEYPLHVSIRDVSRAERRRLLQASAAHKPRLSYSAQLHAKQRRRAGPGTHMGGDAAEGDGEASSSAPGGEGGAHGDEQGQVEDSSGEEEVLGAEFLKTAVTPPPPAEDDPRPECEVCRGCSTRLVDMVRTKGLGEGPHPPVFKMEVGASEHSVFRVYSNRTASRLAVVKLFCLPKNDLAGNPIVVTCVDYKTREYAGKLEKVAAMQRVADACGLERAMVRSWVERVRSVVPATGQKVDAYGIFSELAEGISAFVLTQEGTPKPSAGQVVGMMKAMSGEAVLEAALVDTLLSQCDRHPQNVFLEPGGGVRLIDNDQGFGDGWARDLKVGSVFVPRTYHWNLARIGHPYKVKVNGAEEERWNTSPQMLLDYRCHVDGGEVGTNYPPKLSQCLERMRPLDEEGIQEMFKFKNWKWAHTLMGRVKDMSVGFEHAIDRIAEQHPDNLKFPQGVPCCNLGIDEKRGMRNFPCLDWKNKTAPEWTEDFIMY